MSVDEEQPRRDFWNLGLNPITMLPSVTDSMSSYRAVYENLEAEYNYNN